MHWDRSHPLVPDSRNNVFAKGLEPSPLCSPSSYLAHTYPHLLPTGFQTFNTNTDTHSYPLLQRAQLSILGHPSPHQSHTFPPPRTSLNNLIITSLINMQITLFKITTICSFIYSNFMQKCPFNCPNIWCVSLLPQGKPLSWPAY